MYFADVEGRHFYRVVDPAAVRERVQLRTSGPVFLLVHARRDAVREVFATVPQQSDYVDDWAEARPAASPKRFEAWKESPILRPIRRVRRQMLLRRHRRIFSFSNRAFTADRTSAYTDDCSRNRTSCFCGWTFTSTAPDGTSRNRNPTAYRPVMSNPRYAS